ncbi:cellulase family glycosylhydrolase [Brevundimonas sp. TWP2-3-4b1]|uniref:cellulase family glycosylhydrolase n=1 Tax=Brevundimonas sp. TWP2-3-4b1 TaxID=2804580 RepID=UPI003CEAEE96
MTQSLSGGPSQLTIDGPHFRDRFGRAVILRGVNLGGDSKVPFAPDGHTYLPSDFSDHRTVSFVGRPAPLAEIDSHLARISYWGFNCLRLLTTWEAVEHAGPGIYDQRYLDYYAEVCRRAGRFGLRVFVDFHQDAWSRMSGGDGAPGWTFEAAGLDFTRFASADAAHVMQSTYDHRVGGRQDDYPAMSWGGNYRMPANGIMWTLFFAGDDFAPGCRFNSAGIQGFLQDHYLGSMRAVAERVAHLDNVIGFDTLNEPGTGYVGRSLSEPMSRYRGQAWSPLDGLAVASGISRTVPILALGGRGFEGDRVMNAAGNSIWLPGRTDPFRDAGAWDVESDGRAVAVRPNYFEQVSDRPVEMDRDYMVPFFNRVAETVRAVRKDWLIFAEVDPFGALRGEGFPDGLPERTVNASHWYDLSALVTKRFCTTRSVDILTGDVREGAAAIEDGYVEGLSRLRDIGDGLNGGAPTLIGECGIAYDMNDGEAYAQWNAGQRGSDVWSEQSDALNLMYNALDRLLLSSTQWNYTVSNRNDPMIGDGWNQEDLSIWSIDQATSLEDPDSGGRAVSGFCRPYAKAIQGTPTRQTFDWVSGRFEIVFDADQAIGESTEIYVPASQYPGGYDTAVNGEAFEGDQSGSSLKISPRSGHVTVTIVRNAL